MERKQFEEQVRSTAKGGDWTEGALSLVLLYIYSARIFLYGIQPAMAGIGIDVETPKLLSQLRNRPNHPRQIDILPEEVVNLKQAVELYRKVVGTVKQSLSSTLAPSGIVGFSAMLLAGPGEESLTMLNTLVDRFLVEKASQ